MFIDKNQVFNSGIECEYRQRGKINFYETITKEVIVDGEKYYNTKQELHTFDIDESFKNKNTENRDCWICENKDALSGYGINIKSWIMPRFDLSVDYPYKHAFDNGDIPKYKITNVYYGSLIGCMGTFEKFMEWSLHQGCFTFKIATYGAGYSVNISMPIQYFIDLPYSNHNDTAKISIKEIYDGRRWRSILPKKYFSGELSDSDKTKLAIEIFEYKLLLKNQL